MVCRKLNKPRIVVALLLGMMAFDLPARTLIFQSNNENSPEQPVELDSPAASAAQANVTPQNSGQQYSTGSVAPASSANTELLFMIEQLQQEVRMLRGMVEEQAYQLRTLQESSKARYRDLDARVMALGTTPKIQPKAAAAPVVADSKEPVTEQSSASTPPTEAQRREYQLAYNLIKERKFNEAVDALHVFIEKYPEGELTGNAYYWLGEVYLVLPKLEQAKQAFSIVVKSFPGHRKLPDALFKLAVAHDRLQSPAESEKLLTRVQQEFPESTAAKLAKDYKISR
ncbi:MAG: tol-pal system protein YbgF [Oleiphilaceae bacterium]|nr:tol-pal system protein YbgF [Oleiphilaceae bacterium]